MRHHIILIGIIVIGVFLRIYDYTEIMHFELDQARDAYVVYDALSGNNWPEHGPMARGSELFLGPFFYYAQIISAGVLQSIFGLSIISGMSVPDLVWGILAIPLAYYVIASAFARSSHRNMIALSVALLMATSPFLVTYARFAWNPNGLVFWSLLIFAVIQYVTHEKVLYRKYCAWGVLGIAIGAIMQLHFIAFLVVPLALLGFAASYCMQRVRRGDLGNMIDWKALSIGIGLWAIMLLPVAVYEVRTGGQTVRALAETITDKGAKDEHHILEKIFRSAQQTAHYAVTTMTSVPNAGYLIKTRPGTERLFLCDDECRQFFYVTAIIMIGFLGAIYGLLHRGVMDWYRERSSVITFGLWWAIFAGLFLTVLAYQISPRFYLFVMPVIILLWALGLYFATHVCSILAQKIIQQQKLAQDQYIQKLCQYIPLIIVGVLVWNNVAALTLEYQLLKTSQTVAIESGRDTILKRGDRVTLGALRDVAETISQNKDSHHHIIVGDNRYARALYFLADVEEGNERIKCYVKRGGMPEKTYDHENIYLLVRTKTKEQIPEVLEGTHVIVKKENFGTLALYELAPHTKSQGANDVLPAKCFVR